MMGDGTPASVPSSTDRSLPRARFGVAEHFRPGEQDRVERVVPRGVSLDDAGRLDGLFGDGHAALFDALGLHIPAVGVGLTAERAALERLRALHGRQWDGELWITHGGYAAWRDDEPEQIGAFSDLLDAPVARACWFRLQEWGLPDDWAWERAHASYLDHFEHFSDVPLDRSKPLHALECANPNQGAFS